MGVAFVTRYYDEIVPQGIDRGLGGSTEMIDGETHDSTKSGKT